MCGIAGEVKFDGSQPSEGLSHLMAESISHRGPDGFGTWADSSASLSHRRLAIRGLGNDGDQPSISQNGEIISIFNGEIYNYQELRDALLKEHGIKLKGDCDSELIPSGYLVWGSAFFQMLEGMFAIAIWDTVEKKIYLARDSIGIKPLYYSFGRGRLLFGSEIKAVQVGVKEKNELDLSSLHEFITHGYVGNSRTMLSNIKQVPPGSFIIFSKDQETVNNFWKPQRNVEKKTRNDSQKLFIDMFGVVCEQHLVAEVPLGIMLSGGIDSSLISVMLNNKTLPLYTGRFRQQDFDEVDKASLVAKKIGSRWSQIFCDEAEQIEEDLIKVIHHLDGHLSDPSALAFYRLCRQISQECKVAISGDGADEFFAGYDTYFATRIANQVSNFIPKKIAGDISRRLFFSSPKVQKKYPQSQLLGRFFEGVAEGRLAHAEWRRYVPSWLYETLYGKKMQQFCSSDPLSFYKNQMAPDSDVLSAALIADQSYYLPGDLLHKVDAMSMAHGLEVRVPFLDKRVMEFANGLPNRFSTGIVGNRKKAFLRDVLAGFDIPTQIVTQKKSGFEVPTTGLLKNELRVMCCELFENNADLFYPYFDSDSVKKIWLMHKNSESDFGYLLWTLLTFAVWWSGFYKWRPLVR